MGVFRLLATIFVIGLFLTACSSNQQQPGATAGLSGEYWAKDNLDLQRVGDLLERSDSPEEFEGYLNEDDGINNLDLNGDGYVDYISVDEFEDRGEYERGLSLYCRYGPDDIQELAQIVFYRDDFNYPGARVLVTGNEHIYGDDYYVETNWMDRTVDLITFLFNPREQYYRSPYYYDNYPADYAVYEVVETPVYRTRLVRIDPQPVFVFTTAPTFVNKVKIKSPYRGRQLDRVYARLAKPTREQNEFIRSNPRGARVGKGEREARPDDSRGYKPGRPEFAPEGQPQPKEARRVEHDRGGPPKAVPAERPNVDVQKPAKVERPKVDSPRPAKVERQKPARVEQPRMNPSKPVRLEQPRMNPIRPARVEMSRVNSPKPAKIEQPRVNPARQANPGNPGGKGGGKGKKP